MEGNKTHAAVYRRLDALLAVSGGLPSPRSLTRRFAVLTVQGVGRPTRPLLLCPGKRRHPDCRGRPVPALPTMFRANTADKGCRKARRTAGVRRTGGCQE